VCNISFWYLLACPLKTSPFSYTAFPKLPLPELAACIVYPWEKGETYCTAVSTYGDDDLILTADDLDGVSFIFLSLSWEGLGALGFRFKSLPSECYE